MPMCKNAPLAVKVNINVIKLTIISCCFYFQTVFFFKDAWVYETDLLAKRRMIYFLNSFICLIYFLIFYYFHDSPFI